jgi:hypothetical protein
MSVPAILHAQQLAVMMQNLARAKAELKAHVEQDFEAIKTEFEQTVAHFDAEVSRGKAALSAIDTRIVGYIEQGLHPVQAVNAVANDDAQAAAKAAAVKPS